MCRCEVDCARPAKQSANAGREFLGCEWLREVIVGTGFETCNNVVSIGARRHHDDGHVADASNRATDVEAIDAGQHDVDKYDITGLARKRLKRVFSRIGLFDLPSFVLKSEANGGADSFVVFDGKDAGSHRSSIVTESGPPRQISDLCWFSVLTRWQRRRRSRAFSARRRALVGRQDRSRIRAHRRRDFRPLLQLRWQ